MIAAQTTIFNSAERHVRIGDVHQSVVDASPALSGVAQQETGPFAATGKIIKGQRLFAAVDILDHLVDAFKSQHREDGTKDFTREQFGIGRQVVDTSRLNETFCQVVAPAKNNGALLHGMHKALHGFVVDNAGILRRKTRIGAVEFGNVALHGLHEGLFYTLVHQQIVGSYTRLPCIDKFAIHNAFGRHLNIGIGIDNTRAFPPELEGDGGKIAGGRSHGNASQIGAPRKKNVVPALIEEQRVGFAVSLYHQHIIGSKTFLHYGANNGIGSRSVGREFEDDYIAGSNSTTKRQKSEMKGVVPRRNNEDRKSTRLNSSHQI